MTALPSNMDAILVAIPMVGVLFVGMFRLDELIGRPKKRPERRRPIAGSEQDGSPICIDPDGTVTRKRSRADNPQGGRRRKGGGTDESGAI